MTRTPMAPGVPERAEGHERIVYQSAKPSSETGVWLHRHDHEWQEIGAERWPNGSWHPVFRCFRCGDVICDLRKEVPKEDAERFEEASASNREVDISIHQSETKEPE